MDLETLLIKHEGLRLKPYRDSVDKLTIGVGRNLDDVGITRDEALNLMRSDIVNITRELNQNFEWYDSLDYIRKAALIDMVFNLGITKFLQFNQTIHWLETKNWDKAANEMLNSTWSEQVGDRAQDLAKMIRTGEWP